MLGQLQEMPSLSEVVSLRRGRCRWKQSIQYVVRPENRQLLNNSSSALSHKSLNVGVSGEQYPRRRYNLCVDTIKASIGFMVIFKDITENKYVVERHPFCQRR